MPLVQLFQSHACLWPFWDGLRKLLVYFHGSDLIRYEELLHNWGVHRDILKEECKGDNSSLCQWLLLGISYKDFSKYVFAFVVHLNNLKS